MDSRKSIFSRRGFIGLAAAGVLVGCQPGQPQQTPPQARPTSTPTSLSTASLNPIAPENAGHLKQIGMLNAGGGRVRGLAWSPDGATLAVGADRELQLWDVSAGKKIMTLEGHSAQINGLAWSPKNQQILSCSDDGSVRLWERGKRTALQVLRPTSTNDLLFSVAWSPSGDRLIAGSGYGSAWVWDASTGKKLVELQDHATEGKGAGGRFPFGVYGVAWSPDGQRITSTRYDLHVYVWDAKNYRRLFDLHPSDKPNGVAWSPSGLILASSSDDGTVQLWDQSGKNITVLSGHSEEGWNYPIALSPDGALLVGGRETGLVQVWDTKTGKELAALQGHTLGVWGVSWSSTHPLIATGSDDSTVRLWGVP